MYASIILVWLQVIHQNSYVQKLSLLLGRLNFIDLFYLPRLLWQASVGDWIQIWNLEKTTNTLAFHLNQHNQLFRIFDKDCTEANSPILFSTSRCIRRKCWHRYFLSYSSTNILKASIIFYRSTRCLTHVAIGTADLLIIR